MAKPATSVNYDWFVKADTSKYKGEWIAVAQGKVAAHGKNAKEVREKAEKKYPPSQISLAKVPKEEALVLITS